MSEAPENGVIPIRKQPDMRQVVLTAWPHRPGVFSFQQIEYDYDGNGRLVRRGQLDSTTIGVMPLLDWLKQDWSKTPGDSSE